MSTLERLASSATKYMGYQLSPHTRSKLLERQTCVQQLYFAAPWHKHIRGPSLRASMAKV